MAVTTARRDANGGSAWTRADVTMIQISDPARVPLATELLGIVVDRG